jgi:hypothetical protein
MSKSPVAKGSNVPVWPIFLTPRTRFTRATTPAEEIPAGLLMAKITSFI